MNDERWKIARVISDPPVLSDADVRRLEEEGRRLYERFIERTREMEQGCFGGLCRRK